VAVVSVRGREVSRASVARLVLLAPVLAAAAAAAILRAQAPPLDVKPGLWEMTSKMQPSGNPANAAGTPSASESRKACLTKQKLDQYATALSGQNDPTCKRTFTSSTSRLQVVHIECTGGERKVTSDIRIEAPSPDQLRIGGTMSLEGGAVVTMNSTGRWLSSSCGGVR